MSQEFRHINIAELQASKLSIEEVGDSEDLNPDRENATAEKKEVQGFHYLVTFTDAKTLLKPIKNYRVYLLYATSEKDFAKALHILIQLEKNLYDGVQVSFLNGSENDSDYYRIIIKCDQCAHCKFSIEVDENKCIYQLGSEEFLPIKELLASECKNCGKSPDMRLQSFKSCFEFKLTCKDNALRTSTDAKISIKTLDSTGKLVWKGEGSFAVCFHNMDIAKDEQILKKNYKNIMSKMEGEPQVINNLIQQKVLSKDFEKDNLKLNREELIGAIVRHLFNSDDGLPHFIEALRATKLQQNLELADILYKDFRNS